MMNKKDMRRISKKVFATIMCFVMVVSTLSVSTISNATESTESNTTVNTGTTSTQESANTDPNGTLGKNSDVGIEVTKSITGKAGKKVKVEFKLKSNDAANVKIKSVYPVIDTSFPFETSGDAYKIVSAGDDIEKQKELDASYKLTARNDLQTGYHSVRFIGEYVKMEADGTTQDYYVIKTINIYFTGADAVYDSGDDSKDNSKDDSGDDSGDDGSDGGFYDSGDDDSYDDGGDVGGGSDAEAVAPKLIITGYETVPEKVMAGDTFKITIHVQNTSKSVSVCNGKFLIGNESGSFIPTSGSNAVFVESIPAGKTGDIEVEMKAGADLQQKNYSLVVKGDFDDGKGNNFTSSDSLTIPVYQEISFGISEVSMTPEVLGVGSEGALMFTINNKSSAGVYNVSVSTKSDAVEATESYVGNIAGSSSAYATLNVTGVKDNSETGTINIVISYEDAEGNVSTVEETVACAVSEYGDIYTEDESYDDMEEDDEDESYVSPIIFVVIGLIVVAIITGVVVFLVLRRKKLMAELLEAEDGEDDFGDENF